MAQKIEVLLVDDIDGTPATETVEFALDGSTYEIDLHDEHAKSLRAALAQYVGHARKVPGRSKSSKKKSNGQAATIRQWATEKGIPVPSHGRIPAEVREQYERASA